MSVIERPLSLAQEAPAQEGSSQLSTSALRKIHRAAEHEARLAESSSANLLIFFSGDVHAMAQHPPRFLRIVEDAKQRVRETNVDEVKARLDRGDKFVLVDVREDREFDAGHLPDAVHLGKGVIERDIE